MSVHDNYDQQLLKALQSIADSLKKIEKHLDPGPKTVEIDKADNASE